MLQQTLASSGISAELLNVWLDERERVTCIDVETLARVKDIIRYYKNILAPKINVDILFTGENLPQHKVAHKVIYINYGLLLDGKVDEAIGVTLIKLLEISSRESDISNIAFYKKQAFSILSNVTVTGNKFTDANQASTSRVVNNLAEFLMEGVSCLNEVRLCVRQDIHLKKYIAKALKLSCFLYETDNQIDLDKDSLAFKLNQFKLYHYGLTEDNSCSVGMSKKRLKRCSSSYIYSYFIKMYAKYINMEIKSRIGEEYLSRIGYVHYDKTSGTTERNIDREYNHSVSKDGFQGVNRKKINNLEETLYDFSDMELKEEDIEEFYKGTDDEESIEYFSVSNLFEDEYEAFISEEIAMAVDSFDRSRPYSCYMYKFLAPTERKYGELDKEEDTLVTYPITIVDIT